MIPAIRVRLLRYDDSGEYLADPLEIDAELVVDDRHGVVLEIPLPLEPHQRGESAIQISAQQLERLCAMAFGTVLVH